MSTDGGQQQRWCDVSCGRGGVTSMVVALDLDVTSVGDLEENHRSETEIIDLEPTGACGSGGGGSSAVGGGGGSPAVVATAVKGGGWWLTGGNVCVFFKFEVREKITM
ncbi:unnamed protein product [Lactuca virosa]|uniref:Methyltransferase n=1 Tax=Lactuca virosa TaxID=75947 RepID=A0AAU9LUU4_9ASTR|nr:unnamed protein product [Lactuca virosa]